MTNWGHPDAGPRIYGVPLKHPLTLGHVLFLDEIGSPILRGGDTVAAQDVALAVFICSQPAAEARRNVGTLWFSLLMLLQGYFYARTDHQAAATAFLQWFTAQAKSPAAWRKQSAQPRLGGGAPWWINRIALATGELGLTYTEATTLPAYHVAQLTASLLDARGQAEFQTDEQAKFFAIIKEREAREAQEGNAA